MRKFGSVYLSVVLLVGVACAGFAADPEKNLQGLIMWGAGAARIISPGP